MASIEEGRTRTPGVLDLYRSIFAVLSTPAARRLLAIGTAAALVGTWLLVRTAFGETGRAFAGWIAVSCAVALLSPRAGLLVVAAVVPFDEPHTVARVLGARHVLIAALGIGVAIRVVLRPRSMPWSVPLAAGLAVGVITALGVVHAGLRLGEEFGELSAQNWIAGIGGAMIVLLSAAWVAREGDRTAAVVAIAAVVAAAVLSVADYLDPLLVETGPLAWALADKDLAPRLTGVTASPNGTAALLLGPTCFAIVAAILGRGLRLRVLAGVAALVLLVPLYLTYSRAPLVALALTGLLVAWRIDRRLGAVVLVVGLVGAAIAIPSYMQVRGETLGSAPEPGQVLIATDQQRITAWGAATRMWLDSPLVGFGFRSYKEYGIRYGDPLLNSPHNEWLRLFAEEGILGGAAGIALVVGSIWVLWRRRGWETAAFLAAFLGFAVAASFNNPFLFIHVGASAFTLLGTGLAIARRPPPEQAVSSTGSP